MPSTKHSEDDLLPISALQHLLFCERQWALIHLEGAWAENRLTAEGRVLHERAHKPETESRGRVSIARGLRLRSFRLGLVGVADVVEFHPGKPPAEEQENDPSPSPAVNLPGFRGLWVPLPVEYKRGRPKPGPYDEVQLCAQALCLEEMLQVAIPAGAVFYGQPRRRLKVAFGEELRKQTEDAAARLHELARLGATPPPIYEKKCKSCSLLSLCMPRRLSKRPSVQRYVDRTLDEELS